MTMTVTLIMIASIVIITIGVVANNEQIEKNYEITFFNAF